MAHYDDLRGELCLSPEEERLDLLRNRHEVYDDDGIQWDSFGQRSGYVNLVCSCSEHWIKVRFRWDGSAVGGVEIVDGPTCGLDYDDLAEWVESQIESAWEAWTGADR